MRMLVQHLKFVLVCIGIVTLPQMALAQEKRLRDTAELSFVQTGGNADVSTLAGKNTLKYGFSDKAFSTWKVEALYGQTEGEKTAERYETQLRGDYKVSQQLYWYGFGGWRQDKFSGVDNRYNTGTGAGFPVLKKEKHLLSFELGLNYTKEEYTDETEDNFLEGRSFGVYEYIYNGRTKTKFSQDIEYLQNFKETQKYEIKTTTSLTTAINKMLSLKISYEIHYNNLPISQTLERTDTLFSTTLVVSY